MPGTSRKLTYQGAFLQGENKGYGYFLGTNTCGEILIGAPEILFPPVP